ncbi:hypothetical protein PCANC_12228 [Puccinia coronata f. sp. avenae]|uniref:GH18 domain-containing protein n=1 Tax=Puccinia coronata f. sp. avenae TaxID=200324 RepID=A0A2N5UAA6_9BASI|nr:hypothetical protein PCANC_12228 [Puccinia coronata f. sp. avenae]
MVSQLLKLLLISLPALATSQAPGHVSVSFSTASSSSEAHSDSTKVSFSTTLPVNGTVTPQAGGGNSTHPATPSPQKTGARKLAGYYPVYNHKGQSVSELRYDLYDEIIFFVASTTENFTISTSPFEPNEWDSLALDFVKNCKNNSVLPTYSIGGWNGSRYFSSLVATAENRTAFADSTISFAKKYGFGGIDFDWEYASIQGIGCNVVSDEDVQNQQLLFKEVKSKWPEGKLSTTQSIAGVRDANYQKLPASDVTLMAQVVDEVRIMAYDVHGSWTKTTGPNAPIHAQCADPENQLSVENAIDIYLKQGFKPEQLSLGIPGYAKSWTLSESELTPRIVGNYTSYYYQNFTGIPAGGQYDDKPGVDVCGQKTGNGGSWHVDEIVAAGFLSEDETSGGKGFTRYYDECSGEPFLASNTTLISYDDTASTVAKVVYAKSKGLGGVFFFDTMGPLDSTVKAARTALLN